MVTTGRRKRSGAGKSRRTPLRQRVKEERKSLYRQAISEAAERLAEQGLHFRCHRPRTLWPVLEDTIDFVNSHERVYVVEQSEGAQLAGLLKSEGARADRIISILKYDGLQFSTAELVDIIMEKERLA